MAEIAPDVDRDRFKEFLAEPYVMIKKGGHEWYCIVPKFVDFSVGWLEFTTAAFNVFLVNRYTLWLGDVSEKIRDAIGLDEPDGEFSLDQNKLSYRKKDKSVASKYKEHFVNKSVGETQAKVIKGREFKLLADMIEDGFLPFKPKPVAQEHFRNPEVNFTCDGKYQFQQDAYEKFLELGAVGVYWMTSAGKSFFTMLALDSINRSAGDKLLVVPTVTLIEQWRDYFAEYAPRLLDEVEIVTYNSYEKIKNRVIGVVAFDECHRLPANSFSRLATLNAQYRIGLSASPYREDGRTAFIFALTGYPIGMDWQTIMKILGKKFHAVNVWVVTDMRMKMIKLDQLITTEKTMIFCDGLELGQKVADKYEVPFISGKQKNARMQVARDEQLFVASRVMDLGASIKDLRHLIEIDFLFGSRQQEIQRTGRLFHSLDGSRHDIIMTREEFELYGKRLHALVERGAKVNIHHA
jgi:DNA excision repair protein ERCC-3